MPFSHGAGIGIYAEPGGVAVLEGLNIFDCALAGVVIESYDRTKGITQPKVTATYTSPNASLLWDSFAKQPDTNAFNNGAFSSHHIIKDCALHSCAGFGIVIRPNAIASVEMSRLNVLHNGQAGISASDTNAHVSIHLSNFEGNAIGMVGMNDRAEVSRCSFVSNSICGARFMEGSHATVSLCTFTKNGNGLEVHSAIGTVPTIANCDIVANLFCGVLASGHARPIITDNVITDHEDLCGVMVRCSAKPLVARNIIQRNAAGIVSRLYGDPSVTENLISDNTTGAVVEWAGAGVWKRNKFTQNSSVAIHSRTQGNGIFSQNLFFNDCPVAITTEGAGTYMYNVFRNPITSCFTIARGGSPTISYTKFLFHQASDDRHLAAVEAEGLKDVLRDAFGIGPSRDAPESVSSAIAGGSNLEGSDLFTSNPHWSPAHSRDDSQSQSNSESLVVSNASKRVKGTGKLMFLNEDELSKPAVAGASGSERVKRKGSTVWERDTNATFVPIEGNAKAPLWSDDSGVASPSHPAILVELGGKGTISKCLFTCCSPYAIEVDGHSSEPTIEHCVFTKHQSRSTATSAFQALTSLGKAANQLTDTDAFPLPAMPIESFMRASSVIPVVPPYILSQVSCAVKVSSSSSPHIVKCLFSENTVAIRAHNSHPTIKQSYFTDSTMCGVEVVSSVLATEAAIALGSKDSEDQTAPQEAAPDRSKCPEIVDCRFVQSQRYAIFVHPNARAVIQSCDIIGSRAVGIYCAVNSAPQINDCSFFENSLAAIVLDTMASGASVTRCKSYGGKVGIMCVASASSNASVSECEVVRATVAGAVCRCDPLREEAEKRHTWNLHRSLMKMATELKDAATSRTKAKAARHKSSLGSTPQVEGLSRSQLLLNESGTSPTSPIITSTAIVNCGVGMVFEGDSCKVLVTNSDVRHTTDGAGIIIGANANPTLENVDCRWGRKEGIVFESDAKGTLKGCTMQRNYVGIRLKGTAPTSHEPFQPNGSSTSFPATNSYMTNVKPNLPSLPLIADTTVLDSYTHGIVAEASSHARIYKCHLFDNINGSGILAREAAHLLVDACKISAAGTSAASDEFLSTALSSTVTVTDSNQFQKGYSPSHKGHTRKMRDEDQAAMAMRGDSICASQRQRFVEMLRTMFDWGNGVLCALACGHTTAATPIDMLVSMGVSVALPSSSKGAVTPQQPSLSNSQQHHGVGAEPAFRIYSADVVLEALCLVRNILAGSPGANPLLGLLSEEGQGLPYSTAKLWQERLDPLLSQNILSSGSPIAGPNNGTQTVRLCRQGCLKTLVSKAIAFLQMEADALQSLEQQSLLERQRLLEEFGEEGTSNDAPAFFSMGAIEAPVSGSSDRTRWELANSKLIVDNALASYEATFSHPMIHHLSGGHAGYQSVKVAAEGGTGAPTPAEIRATSDGDFTMGIPDTTIALNLSVALRRVLRRVDDAQQASGAIKGTSAKEAKRTSQAEVPQDDPLPSTLVLTATEAMYGYRFQKETNRDDDPFADDNDAPPTDYLASTVSVVIQAVRKGSRRGANMLLIPKATPTRPSGGGPATSGGGMGDRQDGSTKNKTERVLATLKARIGASGGPTTKYAIDKRNYNIDLANAPDTTEETVSAQPIPLLPKLPLQVKLDRPYPRSRVQVLFSREADGGEASVKVRFPALVPGPVASACLKASQGGKFSYSDAVRLQIGRVAKDTNPGFADQVLQSFAMADRRRMERINVTDLARFIEHLCLTYRFHPEGRSVDLSAEDLVKDRSLANAGNSINSDVGGVFAPFTALISSRAGSTFAPEPFLPLIDQRANTDLPVVSPQPTAEADSEQHGSPTDDAEAAGRSSPTNTNDTDTTSTSFANFLPRLGEYYNPATSTFGSPLQLLQLLPVSDWAINIARRAMTELFGKDPTEGELSVEEFAAFALCSDLPIAPVLAEHFTWMRKRVPLGKGLGGDRRSRSDSKPTAAPNGPATGSIEYKPTSQ